jgi:hypothetical protein
MVSRKEDDPRIEKEKRKEITRKMKKTEKAI